MIVDKRAYYSPYDNPRAPSYRAAEIRAAIAAGVQLPPQALQMAEAASGDSFINALEKLGLKLESRKAPLEVLVIDHAEKTPTAN